MKCYSNKNEIRQSFIRSYSILGNQLIINYATEESVIPYTRENEIKLLNRMKEQLKTYGKDYFERRRIINSKYLFQQIILISLNLFLTFSGGYLSIVNLLCAVLLTGLTIGKLTVFDKHDVLLEDYNKNILFINNEEFINKNLSKCKEINGVSEDVKLYISVLQEAKKEDALDINAIDVMSYEDLKNILKELKSLNSDEFSLESQQSKKLIKK